MREDKTIKTSENKTREEKSREENRREEKRKEVLSSITRLLKV